LTRAVLDPNVLVAAAISPAGTAAACLRALEEGRYELIASPALLAELSGVLRREKFRAFLTAEQADRYVEALARDVTVVGDPAQRPAVSRDSGDDYLVALARVADAHVLVSGDSDLLDLELADLRIESPAAFLELLPD
jgi:uncharacterized protein